MALVGLMDQFRKWGREKREKERKENQGTGTEESDRVK